MTTLFSSPRFLRNVLRVDAVSCLACGALQLALPSTLPSLLGLPAPLVLGTGIFLLVFGALVGWLAMRDPVPRAPVGLLVLGNIGWGIACVALLVGNHVAPTGLGQAYVTLQAATVFLLADLQLLGLWRGASRRAAFG